MFSLLKQFSLYWHPISKPIISFNPSIVSYSIILLNKIIIEFMITFSFQPGPLPPYGFGLFTGLTMGSYISIGNFLVIEIFSIDMSTGMGFTAFPFTSYKLAHYIYH